MKHRFNITVVIILIAINSFFTVTAKAIYIPRQNNNIEQNEFIGTWKIKSIVTESSCPYVIVGSTTQSKLKIELDENKNLKALWEGGNWTNSDGQIKILSINEILSERITFLNSNNNSWKAILTDHLYLNDNENHIMHSETHVKQYKNGEFVGNYKTHSTLTKAE